MPELSLVIPCYNEADNLPLLVSKITEAFKGVSDIEVIIVDNGSSDNTQSVLHGLISNHPFIRSVSVHANQGYGYGILQGLAASIGNVLAWTHADLQTDPKDVMRAYEIYKFSRDKNILVKGKRQNRPFLDTLFTIGMQVMASIVFGMRLDDINAQPKLFSRSFYEKSFKTKAPHDFSLDLYLLYAARKNGLKIKIIPVVFAKRHAGEAKGGGADLKTRLKISARTLGYIFRGF